MTLSQLIKNQDLNISFSDTLSDQSQKIFKDPKSRIFIKQDLPAEGYIAESKYKRFKNNCCINCGEKLVRYDNIYTFTRVSDVKFINVFGYESGLCEECAKAYQGKDIIQSHAFDPYTQERVTMPNGIEKSVTRYISPGWDIGVDPIYDIDCEKVEGVDRWDNLEFEIKNKK